MKRWILSAEADKIQHFVFGSAHLREVVGGSQLLTRFCQEGMPLLLSYIRSASQGKEGPMMASMSNKDIVVADGGSFTILCDSPEEARAVGRNLAELYHELTGSTLTVAEAVPWSGIDSDFQNANKAARAALASAKRARGQVLAIAHSPYTAFCVSCGVAFATTHDKRVHKQEEETEPANYLCQACQNKTIERDRRGRGFLYNFIRTVLRPEELDDNDWRKFDPPDNAEDLAQDWDVRNYVAYMIADGNGMGRIFGQCQSAQQLRTLSESLTRILQESLAVPTRMLMKWVKEEGKKWQVPVLPLILGGDDVFILLPAPYALDFARRFCLEYERLMGEVLKGPSLGINATPTMSAAVVVCKASYPHTLAHQHGAELLKQAKRLSKSVALRHQEPRSTITFDVILGSHIAHAGAAESSQPYRASLRPYWVEPAVEAISTSNSKLPEGVGLPIDRLLLWREKLKALPSRRLEQLRAIFASHNLPQKSPKELGAWQARLEQLIGRLDGQASLVRDALQALGGDADGCWYPVKRPLLPAEKHVFNGHGLPDLLEMWDFCLELTKSRSQYEEEEA